MRDTKRIRYGGLVLSLLVGWAFVATVRAAEGPRPPSDQQVAFAQQVSDLMLNELVSALFTEFDETTPANVPHGIQAISLIFNDLNRNMRLVGLLDPLGGRNNRPLGGFERTALQAALTGQASTGLERENGTWLYRRSVPLSNAFHANCVLCHANFTADFFNSTNNPGQWVGALMLAIPIEQD